MIEKGNKGNLTDGGEHMNEAASISADEDNIIELVDIAFAPPTEAEEVIVLTDVADLAFDDNDDIVKHTETLTDSSIQDDRHLTFINVTRDPHINVDKAVESKIIPGESLKDSEIPEPLMNRGENLELESIDDGAFTNENASPYAEGASGEALVFKKRSPEPSINDDEPELTEISVLDQDLLVSNPDPDTVKESLEKQMDLSELNIDDLDEKQIEEVDVGSFFSETELDLEVEDDAYEDLYLAENFSAGEKSDVAEQADEFATIDLDLEDDGGSDTFLSDDLQKADLEINPQKISSEMLETAVMAVVKEVCSERKIEHMLLHVIEGKITGEIERVKNILFGDTTINN